MTPNRAIRKFLQLYAETFTKTFIQKPISKALYDTWRWADSKEKPRKESEGKE